MRDFVWEGTSEREGSHLVEWELVQKLVDFRGLGITPFELVLMIVQESLVKPLESNLFFVPLFFLF